MAILASGLTRGLCRLGAFGGDPQDVGKQSVWRRRSVARSPMSVSKSRAFAARPERDRRERIVQFEKASPFRPRIARTMPHLGQCDAIATRRYIPSHL